ncbi:MAG: sulfotransferase family protein [Pseudomonadota bacterium]
MPRPSFIGLGAAKAGTTKVAQLLSQHPQIFMSSPKELHFFDGDAPDSHLAPDSYFSQFEEAQAAGEFTPSYLFMPEAPGAIAKLLGTEIKFIVALRNPVDRAYSHYCHAVNNWSEPKWQERNYPAENAGFEDALIEEPMRLQAGRFHIRHQSYFSKGLYALQLRRFFAFFPQENFFIYLFEDFVADPHGVLASLCRFLGVDENFEFADVRERVNAQTQGEIPLDLRSKLTGAYREANNELAEMIGRDLSLWNG